MKNEPVYIVSAEETYHYGQIIYEEGSSGDWIYVILSGLVELSKIVGDKKSILEILQSGDVFGVTEYIGRTKRTTTARSIGMTTLGLVDREFLDREYNQLSIPLRGMLETLAHKPTRILSLFSEFCEKQRQAGPKILPLLFSDGKNTYRAFTADMNAKGLFIVTEKLFQQGQEIYVKMQIPGVTDLVQVKCEVVQSRSDQKSQPAKRPGMLVKFTKISRHDYGLLREFLSSKQKTNQHEA